MSIFKYEDFLLESTIYDLLLESKLYFSKNLIGILNKMGDDDVAKKLIKLHSQDVDDLKFNYLDVTDDKSRISFIPDDKAQKIISKRPQLFQTIESGRNLTHGQANDKIYELLGYQKPEGSPWSPSEATIGIILNEIVSPTSGKIYAIFEEYGGQGRKTVINKENLEVTENSEPSLWTNNRNPINVGRIARAILKSADYNVKEKDIEDFVNKYKATFDFMKDRLKQFDVVTGDKIAYWYNGDHYKKGDGSLNNSCMSHVDEEYFNIYCENPQVSLVILYGDNVTIVDGKYTDKKIKGRAILWGDVKIAGDVNQKFLDRIYTVDDCDVELFKQFAKENGWWCKTSQTMDPDTSITDGTNKKSVKMTATLDKINFEYYPYMDTMCYIHLKKKVACNKSKDYDRCARDTDGGWDGDDYDDDDDDDD